MGGNHCSGRSQRRAARLSGIGCQRVQSPVIAAGACDRAGVLRTDHRTEAILRINVGMVAELRCTQALGLCLGRGREHGRRWRFQALRDKLFAHVVRAKRVWCSWRSGVESATVQHVEQSQHEHHDRAHNNPQIAALRLRRWCRSHWRWRFLRHTLPTHRAKLHRANDRRAAMRAKRWVCHRHPPCYVATSKEVGERGRESL